MRSRVGVVAAGFLALGLLAAPPSWATDYYVDPQSGSDSAPGTTPARAWRSLGKVNGIALRPGDRILFVVVLRGLPADGERSVPESHGVVHEYCSYSGCFTNTPFDAEPHGM
jgi:hypothetical protein